MTDLQIAGVFLWGYLLGIVFGYVLWAPETPFKTGFMKGMTFGLWREK